MLGKTNASFGRGGSGGGEIVTAMNKTGKEILIDDKVWLNKYSQTAGSGYQVRVSATAAYPVLSPNGLMALYFDKLYSVGDSSATTMQSLSNVYYGVVKYLDENTLAIGGTQWSGDMPYTYLTASGAVYYKNERPIGGKYIAVDSELQEINLSTGEVVKSYSWMTSARNTVKVGEYFYRLNSMYASRFKIENEAIVSASYTFTNGLDLCPIGVTSDSKYIIASTTDANHTSSGTLKIIEVVSPTELKVLQDVDLPEDLQYYKSGLIAFNPYSGYLTIASYHGTEYGIFKYSDGSWTKISADLGTIPTNGFATGITLANDGSRAIYGAWKNYVGAYNTMEVINLTSFDDVWAAIPYKTSTITESSLTGFAAGNAAADSDVEVSIATKSQ